MHQKSNKKLKRWGSELDIFILPQECKLSRNITFKGRTFKSQFSAYFQAKKQANFVNKNKNAVYNYQHFLTLCRRKKHLKLLSTNEYEQNDNLFNYVYGKTHFIENPKRILNDYNTLILERKTKNIKESDLKWSLLGVNEGLVDASHFISRFRKSNEKNERKILLKKVKSCGIVPFYNGRGEEVIKKEGNVSFGEDDVNLTESSGCLANNNTPLKIALNKKYLTIDQTLNIQRKSNEKAQKLRFEIKKLNDWDYSHLNKQKKCSVNLEKKITETLKALNSSAINEFLNVKNDRKKLEVLKRNKYLNEFFDTITMEQEAIYAQNLKNQRRHSVVKGERNKLEKERMEKKMNISRKNNILGGTKRDIGLKYKNRLTSLNEEKQGLEKSYGDLMKRLDELTALIKRDKKSLERKVKISVDYYYQILKKGIDVRSKGLMWVVVKLLELKALINKYNFPVFLDEHQIEYLMSAGIKSYELSELLKLFKYLQMRQKSLKEAHIKEEQSKEKVQKEKELKKLIETKHKRNINYIGNDYKEYIEEILIRYKNVLNLHTFDSKEEDNLLKIGKVLKREIFMGEKDDVCWGSKESEGESCGLKEESIGSAGKDCGMCEKKRAFKQESYYIPGSSAEYFSKDTKLRQYFDDIVYLNDEIIKRRKELKEMKERELQFFNTENKIKIQKYKNNIDFSNESDKNDLVFSALFGNGITL